MTTIAISEFRARIQYFLRKAKQGERIIVTSHGENVAEIGPVKMTQAEARKRMRELKKKIWVGDVVSPLGEDWKVLRDDYRP